MFDGRMFLNLNQLLDKIRSCCNCHYPFTVKDTLLCEKCYYLVLSDLNPTRRELIIDEKKLIVDSLFDWVPEKNNALSALILALKGGLALNAWAHYGKLFYQQCLVSKKIKTDSLLIPCPSKSGKREHAEIFCQSLSHQLHLDIEYALFVRSHSQQKEQLRRQRKNQQLTINEKFSTTCFSSRPIVFVDDIVTTGYTSLSASKALGNPQHFTVWALAYREFRAK